MINIPYVLLWSYDIDDIGLNIYGSTTDVMLDSLPIYHPRKITFRVIDFDGTGTIYFLDNVGTFPFREKLACKES